jgi:hypothetical protein
VEAPLACTLGFSVHSGWAAVVVIGGSAGLPQVLARERIDMTDPRLRRSAQPYHAIEALPLARAQQRLAAMQASAGDLARAAVGALAQTARAGGAEPRAAGILDSAGRAERALEAILASHALIHTADGNHFRDALAAGCTAQGLAVTRVRQRDLGARAAEALGRPAEELAAACVRLGRGLAPPWGADQKAAALLAWLLLATAARAAG